MTSFIIITSGFQTDVQRVYGSAFWRTRQNLECRCNRLETWKRIKQRLPWTLSIATAWRWSDDVIVLEFRLFNCVCFVFYSSYCRIWPWQ